MHEETKKKIDELLASIPDANLASESARESIIKAIEKIVDNDHITFLK